jgi:hypothetical protein
VHVHPAPVQTNSKVLQIHISYISVCKDERKEELQSYYKLTDEDMEQITKEWLEEFLVPVVDAELSDTDTIGIPLVTQVEHVG